MHVRAKKHLGQHFLTDETIAEKIANSLVLKDIRNVLEIGPGMGVLTKYLLQRDINLKVIEIDEESVRFLKSNYSELDGKIIEGDFLQQDIPQLFEQPFAIAGNFPYNISSQILFKVLEHKDKVLEVVGMFQKEVAERIASQPGNRDYGIPSVLLQAFFDIEFLFVVQPDVFTPPPKVKSGVIRLTRNFEKKLLCDEKKFKLVVKTAFNQRRKVMRNSLKSLMQTTTNTIPYLDKRPEQLSWKQFEEITLLL
jgi:16S rRNA (adenine1518-N6/adenine1519-N6)-dimethyltransferase